MKYVKEQGFGFEQTAENGDVVIESSEYGGVYNDAIGADAAAVVHDDVYVEKNLP